MVPSLLQLPMGVGFRVSGFTTTEGSKVPRYMVFRVSILGFVTDFG